MITFTVLLLFFAPLHATIFLFSSILIVNLIGNIPRHLFLLCAILFFTVFYSWFLLHPASPSSKFYVCFSCWLNPLPSYFPLTLSTCLVQNVYIGHTTMYMLSCFTLLPSVLSPFIYVVLSLLFVLKLYISALQSYVLVSLLPLYVKETL